MSPTKSEIASPPKTQLVSPPKKENSPPVASFKIKKNDDAPVPKSIIKESSSIIKESSSIIKESSSVMKESPSMIKESPPSIIKKIPLKTEQASVADDGALENAVNKKGEANNGIETAGGEDAAGADESNGVGDKIKKFERAAEDAGRPSRAGSVRRARAPAEPADAPPPPATPFKDNAHFEPAALARQQSLSRNSPPEWPREQPVEEKIKKPEPQKIIKPEFKPMPSPVDATIRSPSLGAKIGDRFPSHGTAFRNVAAAESRAPHKPPEDAAGSKPCKAKPKEKYSVSKGSSYFTRGSEEIWLVKKKDIEEIEERVLDSFRRAGGGVCARGESLRPAADGGHAHGAPPFTHATMGRRRQMYARSESLDPQGGARAQTLKRQTSVACTCGHDKKARAKSAGAEAPRARSRSHGDDHAQSVLDKYETLV